jgi:hypothetical protein
MSASLGRDAFGFMWAAVACYFIATVLLCAGGAASASSSGGRRGGGKMFFGRKQKAHRDRGSFIDKETAVDGERSSFTRA